MKFRRRSDPHVLGFQIAPMVDVLLVLLCFFILTWNFARREQELDVKVPTADNGGEPTFDVNQTVLNVREGGVVIWNNKEVPQPELFTRLKVLSDLYPDYSIIVRGDENAKYMHISAVLDTCRAANIWNVAFATRKVE